MAARIFFVACLMILSLAVPGCSRLYQFEGVIVDGGGNPVSVAKIELYPADWNPSSLSQQGGTSNADGSFDAHWSSAPGVEYFRMIVTKGGFREQSQMVQADASNLRIVLERTESTEHQNNSR